MSEVLIHEALRSFSKGRTTFIIAHRLSTIAHADKIFFLEQGEIREQGTHEELMRIPDGNYRSYVTLQAGAQ